MKLRSKAFGILLVGVMAAAVNVVGAESPTLKAGARGFLLKGAEPDQLVQAIHAAVQGDDALQVRAAARR